ncbi:MAG: arginase [Thermoanaerobaculia bacterium]|nr:arginase [Thermoanaerobaculia bacterium]
MASLAIIGVPIDLGQSRRGVDMGPAALRYAGLDRKLSRLGCEIRDLGNLDVPVRDTLSAEGGLRFLPAVAAACEAIRETGRRVIERGDVPLYLGGDHSIAVGTVAALAQDRPAGLLWIDAHGDFNTPETSPSGNLHGMPLAALVGRGVRELVEIGGKRPTMRPADVVLVGVRDLDPEERVALRASGIKVYTMQDIDREGIGSVAERAVRRLSHLDRVHVSLDMDALDPREAPGVGTPVGGGLTYREAHLLMETAAERLPVASLDVVEINPILDERNRTAELAIELVMSGLGKSIL